MKIGIRSATLWIGLAPFGALCAAENGTSVRCDAGKAELRNEQGSLELHAGLAGKMEQGRAPEAVALATPIVPVTNPVTAAPANQAPLIIEWQPGTRSARVDGVAIALAAKTPDDSIWTGQSPDGRFVIESDGQKTFSVRDTRDGRHSERAKDGAWTHFFGGQKLCVDAQGQAVLECADGSKTSAPLSSAAPPTEPVTPVNPVAAAPDPKNTHWQLGVRLAATPGPLGMLKVEGVDKGSPAEKAGLKSGDEIFSLEGVRRPDKEHIVEILKRQPLGAKLRLVVLRSGTISTLYPVAGVWEGE